VNAAPEPEEDNTKSYEQYLADLAEKRQALAGDSLAIRKPNEGSNQKFPEGKPVERAHEEYFAGAGAKQHRAKENKTKNSLALDGQYYAAPDTGDRGRGGARGGRGEGRGGRGRGEGRGRGGRGRGEGRGGAPSGARTEQRSGPRGGAINTKDESAFPSLGA
jgi:plasminogen activator inhibitor 1 RNA-binding protein